MAVVVFVVAATAIFCPYRHHCCCCFCGVGVGVGVGVANVGGDDDNLFRCIKFRKLSIRAEHLQLVHLVSSKCQTRG